MGKLLQQMSTQYVFYHYYDCVKLESRKRPRPRVGQFKPKQALF